MNGRHRLQWSARANGCSDSGCRVDDHAPMQEVETFLHADQPKAVTADRNAAIEPAPVVDHFQLQLAIRAPQHDSALSGTRMLDNVRECFLQHPKQADRHAVGWTRGNVLVQELNFKIVATRKLFAEILRRDAQAQDLKFR